MKGMSVLLDIPEAYQWTDYSLEIDVWTHARDLGIIWHYIDEDNWLTWRANVQAEPYCCHGILKMKDGVPDTPLRQMASKLVAPLRERAWTRVRIDIVGNKYSIYYDGVFIDEWEDGSGMPVARGTMGLWTAYNRHVRWNNLKIYDRPPIDYQRVNPVLSSLGAPPLPNERRLLQGVSWTSMGRKSSNPNDTYAYSNTTSSGFGVFGDGPVTTQSLFSCHQQTIRIPENSNIGTLASKPVWRAKREITVGDFNIEGGHESLAMQAGDSTARAVLSVDRDSGTLYVQQDELDFERQSSYKVTVTATSKLYDSGWFPLHSLMPAAGSFKEISLPSRVSDIDPALLDVRVTFRATDGANEGFTFDSQGAGIIEDDYTDWPVYGGLVVGVDKSSVRMWAPSHYRFQRGSIINIGPGYGGMFDDEKQFLGEKNTQTSHNVEARLEINPRRAADFDSGWFRLESEQTSDSYEAVPHYLNGWPDEVIVLVRMVDGPNEGRIFRARGNAQKIDYYGTYGGVVYGFTADQVRVWLPSRSGSGHTGFAGLIGRGWGGEQHSQRSLEVDIRVMAWKDLPEPDFVSEWSDTEFLAGGNGYAEVKLHPNSGTKSRAAYSGGEFASEFEGAGMEQPPVKVQVMTRTKTGDDVIFPAVSMGGNAAYVWWIGTGGIVYAFNQSTVRLWSPTADYNTAQFPDTRNVPIRVSDGWGGETDTVNSQIGQVQVRVWTAYPGQRDTVDVTVELTDLGEPPVTADSYFDVPEATRGGSYVGYYVGEVNAQDDDAGTVLTYDIIAGNDMNAFRIDAMGRIYVNNSAAIDFETQTLFHVAVLVSDGVFSNIAMLRMTVINVNDPVTVYPANITIFENQEENYLVGNPVEAYDPDVDQTILFSIVGGNTDDAFKINPCR